MYAVSIFLYTQYLIHMQVFKEFQMIRDVTDEDIEHYIESTGSMLINLIGNMDATVKEVSC